jgi:hypothetical protein
MPVKEARDSLSKVLGVFRQHGRDSRPVFIGAHRKAEAVILPVELFQELLPLIEDHLIAQEIRQRLANDTGERISHEELLAELGYEPDAFK